MWFLLCDAMLAQYMLSVVHLSEQNFLNFTRRGCFSNKRKNCF